MISVPFLLAALPFGLFAQSACSNSSLNGAYFYLLDGSMAASGSTYAYAELGRIVADGSGGVTGQGKTSFGGALVPFSLTGTYAVQGNCTATMAYSVTNQFGTAPATVTFQIVDGGHSALVAYSSSGGVLTGRAYRAANIDGAQCSVRTLNGAYGYLLSGVVQQGGGYYYSQAGQVLADSNGGITVQGFANTGSGAVSSDGSGTYSISTDCTGTAHVSNQYGTVNYSIAALEGGSALFLVTDSNTTVAGTMEPQSINLILPQWAFGGGWYSALYFTSTNDSAVSFPVNFTADDGTPLVMESLGGASTQVNLAAHGTAMIEAPNAGNLQQGYATFTLPPGVTGYGVFRQTTAGVPDQEAVVPFSSASGILNTLAWDETAFTTAVAIVNPSAVQTTVTIAVRDESGNSIGSSTVPLPPHGKSAVVLRNLSGLSAMLNKRGSAQFQVSTGNVAVLGLRFGNVAFTSIPTR